MDAPEVPEDMGLRVRLFIISRNDLEQMMRGKARAVGLPSDAAIYNMTYEPRYDAVAVLVRSVEFSPLPNDPGCEIPRVLLLFEAFG
jgi:hypothetical protein